MRGGGGVPASGLARVAGPPALPEFARLRFAGRCIAEVCFGSWGAPCWCAAAAEPLSCCQCIVPLQVYFLRKGQPLPYMHAPVAAAAEAGSLKAVLKHRRPALASTLVGGCASAAFCPYASWVQQQEYAVCGDRSGWQDWQHQRGEAARLLGCAGATSSVLGSTLSLLEGLA